MINRNKAPASVLFICLLISFFCAVLISSGIMIFSSMATLAHNRTIMHQKQLALQALIEYALDLAKDNLLQNKEIQNLYTLNEWFTNSLGFKKGFVGYINFEKTNGKLKIKITLEENNKNQEHKIIIAFLDENKLKIYSMS